MVIDGKAIAAGIIQELKQLPRPEKSLAAIFVGDNPQSQSFLKQKEKIAKELAIAFQLNRFSEEISEAELIAEIQETGADKKVGGMIVQLPLPRKFNRDKVIAAIPPRKDVDALTPESRKLVDPLPVAVVKEILSATHYELRTKTIVVVGRGFLVGKPIADYFRNKCKKLILLHSKSNLSEIVKGDVIITGVGKAGLITSEMLKSGAGVIDFGYGIKDKKIYGDFDSRSLATGHKPLAFYTPTPGGTGPILVAEIFRNFYKLSKQ